MALSLPNVKHLTQPYWTDERYLEGKFYHPEKPEGVWFSAMVFNEQSQYGYKNGRVSKIDILAGPRDLCASYDEQVVYRFDRHERSRSKKGFPVKVVNALVKELETLPELYIPNA